MPARWEAISLGELMPAKTDVLDPADHPDTEFELWSVPAFPTAQPEIILGRAIGSAKQRVRPNDVLLCKINPRINRVWKVGPLGTREQIASTEWIVLRCRHIDPDFLVHALREPRFREQLCTEVSGVGGSLTRARPRAVRKLRIPLPPREEQARIAARLRQANEGRIRVSIMLEEVPALLGKFRRSVLATAFRGDLTADWRETSGRQQASTDVTCNSATETAPRLLPRGWKWASIRELTTDIQTGPFGAQLHKADFTRTGVPVLGVGNIGWGKIDDQDLVFVTPGKAEALKRYLLRTGDLLFTRSGSVGRVAMLPEHLDGALMTGHLLRVRVDTRCYAPELLVHALRGEPTMRGQLRQATRGATRAGFNTSLLAGLLVPVPPRPEQAAMLDRLHPLLAGVEHLGDLSRLHQELDRLDRAILIRAFRGELVPHHSSDEPASILINRIRAELVANAPSRSRTARKRDSNQRRGRRGHAGTRRA